MERVPSLMSLNVSIAQVEFREDLLVDVLVGVSVVGFEPSVAYDGEVNVVNGGPRDAEPISGTVGTGAGDEHQITLDPGLSLEDLPETVFVTAAVEDASGAPFTDQVELELDVRQQERGELITPRRVAIGSAVVLGGVLLRRTS